MRAASFSTALFFAGLLTAATVSCTQTAGPAAEQKKVAPAASASRPSAAGTWSWTVDAGGNQISQSVALKQEGEKLTGTFTDGFDNATFPIKEGKIIDGTVTLTIERPFMDAGILTLKFAGKLSGDTITGKLEFTIGDQPNTADWTAKRTGS